MSGSVLRPETLVLGPHAWDWSRPYVLGILNVTPDSFSDGGRYDRVESAMAQGERLFADGADALDIGGESTRPGAPRVPAAEQLARVLPVIEHFARAGRLVSVDTTRADVAEAAFRAGARILNDVGMGDPPAALARVVAQYDGAYIRMHARGTPATMTAMATYADLESEVLGELSTATSAIEREGVARARVLIDPGIGFAKHATHSLRLLGRIASLTALGYAVCVGPSRKSFIDATDAYAPAWDVEPSHADARVGGTAAAVALAVAGGALVLRVHDVAVMRQAARVAHAIARHGAA